MKKLKAVRWKPRQKPQNLDYTNILAKHCHPSQCFHPHEAFTQAIRRRQLTESVEILAQYGFDGDLGILVLGELQDLLGRVAK